MAISGISHLPVLERRAKRVGILVFAAGALGMAAQTSPARLELTEAMSRVLAASPDIAALEAAAKEQSALADQAGRWSNPVLTLEKENFSGSRAYRGNALAEYTATVDQTFELGRKRGLRRELALAGVQMADLELAVRRSALVAETRRRYASVQLAQARQQNAGERLTAARAAAKAVQAKRGAGVSGGLEAARTQVSVSLAEVDMERMSRQLDQDRERLARLWGGTAATEVGAVAELSVVPVTSDEGDLGLRLEQGARWRLAEMRRDSQQRAVALAQRQTWPDVTVSVGRRWFEEGGDHAWVAGLSLPFPLWDQNRDGVRAAREGLARTAATMAAEHRGLREALSLALAKVKSARATAERLERETLPLARRSYALVEEGFKLGRYDLLYLLEAQQTLYATETSVLDARAELHFALIDLEELLDPPLAHRL